MHFLSYRPRTAGVKVTHRPWNTRFYDCHPVLAASGRTCGHVPWACIYTYGDMPRPL